MKRAEADLFISPTDSERMKDMEGVCMPYGVLTNFERSWVSEDQIAKCRVLMDLAQEDEAVVWPGNETLSARLVLYNGFLNVSLYREERKMIDYSVPIEKSELWEAIDGFYKGDCKGPYLVMSPVSEISKGDMTYMVENHSTIIWGMALVWAFKDFLTQPRKSVIGIGEG